MTTVRRLTLTFILTSVAWTQAALAQKADVDAQLFRPMATAGGTLQLDDGFLPRHFSFAGSLWIDYAHNPLVLRDASDKQQGVVVGNLVDADLAISLALWRRVEVGLLLPVLLFQDPDDTLFRTAGGLSQAAIGDLRIEVKLRLGEVALGAADRSLGFAVAGSLAVPTGDDNSFFGEGGVTFRPRAMMTARFPWLQLTLQISAILRARKTIGDLDLGQQLQLGLGARLPLARGFGLVATALGQFQLSGTSSTATTPIEFLGGPEYRLAALPIELTLAGGRGLTTGYGAPDARLVFAVRYQPRVADRDGDGLNDDVDACPDVPGPRANRGCPDKDSDGDGLIDREDRCPREAGPRENQGCPWPDRDRDGTVDRDDLCPDVPGPKVNRGCPDKDSDGDGLIDREDRCPQIAGPKENQGCPWPDRDGDSILDKDDKCPDVPGIKENDGCPDRDTDGDGIVDRLDKCPTEKEVFNGFEDEDGCPDKGPELAVLTATGIDIKQQVNFEVNKAIIKQRSFLLLATVARILTLHPEITRLRVEGHTDSTGKRERNLTLSQARADSVMEHLIQVNGIGASRLSAQGFGPDRPIADNKTPSGRAKNRRSAFVIVEQGGAAQPPPPAYTPRPNP